MNAATRQIRVTKKYPTHSLSPDQVQFVEALFRLRTTPKASKPTPKRRPDLLNTEAAAAYLGVSRRTLEDWRTKVDAAGNVLGPKITRSGGRVFYRTADLDAFQTAETHLTAGQVRLKQQRRKPRRVTSRTP